MAQLRAEASLAFACAFMNTLDGDVDHLADPAAFGSWLVATSRFTDPTAGERDLALARRLRDALRRLARSGQHGGVDAAATDELNDLAAELGLWARFTPGAEVELGSSTVGARGALGAVVAAVAVAMADGSWDRVKVCDNDECAAVFYDSSRNRSGRWCTMAVCGNRVKARNFRQRQTGRTRTE